MDRTIHSESFQVPPPTNENSQQELLDEDAAAVDIRIFYPNGTGPLHKTKLAIFSEIHPLIIRILCILFKAVQFCVENGADATAADLLALMAEHLQIDDVAVAEEALAIWIVSPLLGCLD